MCCYHNIRIIITSVELHNQQTDVEMTDPMHIYDTIPDMPVNVQVTNPIHMYDTIADKPVSQTDMKVTNSTYDDTIADKKPVKEPYAEVIIPIMQPNPAYAVP